MVWSWQFKKKKFFNEPKELFSMPKIYVTVVIFPSSQKHAKTGVKLCGCAQCDTLWNLSMLSTICWKCDFFLTTDHYGIPLNISPLLLHKIHDQLSCSLVLISHHQAVITYLFSVIGLWKRNIILWWAGKLLKSRKLNFHFKRQKRTKIHME